MGSAGREVGAAMDLPRSRHAARRRRERGINIEAIDVVVRFGECRPSGGGPTLVARTALGGSSHAATWDANAVASRDSSTIALVVVDAGI